MKIKFIIFRQTFENETKTKIKQKRNFVTNIFIKIFENEIIANCVFKSSIFKNQFLACQISLVMGFLPALLLSGLMFPISSMPAFFRYLTAVLPQRYFVSFIESEFLAGTISDIVLINTVYLSCLCLVLLFLVYKNTLVRLEK